MWKCICMAVALWGCTGVLQAKVVLPSVFTDNMVLQQKTDITFYGDATKNKQLTVKTGWNGKEYYTEADGQQYYRRSWLHSLMVWRMEPRLSSHNIMVQRTERVCMWDYIRHICSLL